jgi:hypothetical protein
MLHGLVLLIFKLSSWEGSSKTQAIFISVPLIFGTLPGRKFFTSVFIGRGKVIHIGCGALWGASSPMLNNFGNRIRTRRAKCSELSFWGRGLSFEWKTNTGSADRFRIAGRHLGFEQALRGDGGAAFLGIHLVEERAHPFENAINQRFDGAQGMGAGNDLFHLKGGNKLRLDFGLAAHEN